MPEPLRTTDPRRVGAYEIVGLLGEGGQGAVYRGEGPSGEAVAVKLLHARFSGDAKARSRFAGELAHAERVAPFCTARVIDADLEGDRPYIVSEFVDGPSLSELISRGDPPRGPALERLAIATVTALAAIHEFDKALLELTKAEHLGGPGEKIGEARASIYQATGKYDDAWKIRSATDEKNELSPGLASRAALVGDMQKPSEAERLFAEARAKFRDVSPFMLSWMDFQHGYLLERNGDRDGAKKWLAEAHQVNPTYTHAAVHLAGLSTPDEAVAILKPLVDTSDDPDVLAALADALRRTGKEEEAKPIRAKAKARYQELVTSYPHAFADHAAQFFLGFDGDVPKALELAKKNEANRKTVASVELLLTASLAANAKDVTCQAVSDGLALPYSPPSFRANFAPVAVGCALDGGVLPPADAGTNGAADAGKR